MSKLANWQRALAVTKVLIDDVVESEGVTDPADVRRLAYRMFIKQAKDRLCVQPDAADELDDYIAAGLDQELVEVDDDAADNSGRFADDGGDGNGETERAAGVEEVGTTADGSANRADSAGEESPEGSQAGPEGS